MRANRYRFLLLAAALAAAAARAQKWTINACQSFPALTGFECTKAYDNNTATVWRSTGGQPSYIRFDLGVVTRLKRIVLKSAATHPTWVYISTSNDGINWGFQRLSSISVPTTDINLAWNETFEGRHVLFEFWDESWDLQEVELRGPGLYNEEEVLVKNIPLGFWDMNVTGQIIIPPVSYSGIPMNRVVGMNTDIVDNNGNHFLLERFSERQQPVKNPGGNAYFAKDANGVWSLNVSAGTYFKEKPEFSGTSLLRGFISIYYLSRDPDFP